MRLKWKYYTAEDLPNHGPILSVRSGYDSCPNCLIGKIENKKRKKSLKLLETSVYTCNICGCNRHIKDWQEINCKHTDFFKVL